MWRKLLNIATTGSVLLGMAVAVLWVRSYRNNWHGDDFTFTMRQRHWELLSQGGGLTLLEADSFPWFFSGPATGGKTVPRYNTRDVFGFPYWIALAATVPLPLTRFIVRRRLRRRAADGLCLQCGYDLRASAGRCPECGSSVAPAASTAA
jgi:hypothetical protein